MDFNTKKKIKRKILFKIFVIETKILKVIMSTNNIKCQ